MENTILNVKTEATMTTATATKKKRNKRPRKGYCVDSEFCLYYLSDLGLLHYLHGIQRHKTDGGRRVWYFDRVPDVKEAIMKFKEKEKTAE